MTTETTLVPALRENTPSLPALIHVRRGKGFVGVQHFTQSLSAKEINAALKASNPKMSSKARSAQTLATLRGERNPRELMAIAWVQSRFQAGDVADRGEISSKTSCLRLVKAPEPLIVEKVVSAPETRETILAEMERLNAKLAAMGSK